MEKKTLSKITVTDIVKDCGFNRKTFYYHFQDVPALLKWTLEQEAVNVIKKFDLLNELEEALRFTVHYIRENCHMISCAYDAIGRDELKRSLNHNFSSTDLFYKIVDIMLPLILTCITLVLQFIAFNLIFKSKEKNE